MPRLIPIPILNSLRYWYFPIAALLLFAAGTKIFGQSWGPDPQSNWILLPVVQSIVIAWEILLASLLLSGHIRHIAWLLCVITFLTFALVSADLAQEGFPTCNCFGPVAVNPWLIFGFDTLVVCFLFLAVQYLLKFELRSCGMDFL
ncbi:MauE/DoxX family redox-associated membrane protein [Telmatocola sphagniphila]|uniref:MauE/DoxX family redox-associated membrane protein n=1 Tax=Telmatocola sphagniphila TaxID=1123043 RepID=UPI0036F44782